MPNKYRVYAENESGTTGEAPTFITDTPEEAEAEYLSWRTPLNIVKVELVEEDVEA